MLHELWSCGGTNLVPRATCLLVSTKTWSSGIINFRYYDDCLLNLSNCSCINSLRTQMYFRLSVDSAEINWLQRNQVTAGNTSKFVNTKICRCCSKLLASNLYSSFKSAYWRYHGRWIDSGWKLHFYADALKENPINLYIFWKLNSYVTQSYLWNFLKSQCQSDIKRNLQQHCFV